MKPIYERHPVTPERKTELRQQGYTIIDAVFAPKGYEHPETKREQAETQAKAAAEQAERDRLAALVNTQPETAQKIIDDGLDEMGAEQLHALAKERGVKVHANAGADKVREALRRVVNV